MWYTDNTAETVLDMFIDAILEHGVPSRVRGDWGGENRNVSILMILLCSLNHASFMWGPSVFNTQIERLWLEVCMPVAHFFFQLERCHLLRRQDKHHCWLLHYLFLRFINEDCEKFCDEWNSHPVSGEGGGFSPNISYLVMNHVNRWTSISNIVLGPCLYGRITARYLWWLWRFDKKEEVMSSTISMRMENFIQMMKILINQRMRNLKTPFMKNILKIIAQILWT